MSCASAWRRPRQVLLQQRESCGRPMRWYACLAISLIMPTMQGIIDFAVWEHGATLECMFKFTH